MIRVSLERGVYNAQFGRGWVVLHMTVETEGGKRVYSERHMEFDELEPMFDRYMEQIIHEVKAFLKDERAKLARPYSDLSRVIQEAARIGLKPEGEGDGKAEGEGKKRQS